MFLRKKTASPPPARPAIGRYEAFLLLLWLIVNSFFLLHRGIYLEGESAKYIRQAHIFLQTGGVETPNFRLYFMEIALIAGCIQLHLGFGWVVLLQLLTNLAAVAFFYRTVLYLVENKNAAFAATLLLLLDLPWQEFNTFLYTESLFFSLTLILSCYILLMERLTMNRLLTVLLLLTLICFTRPTGLLFLPPVFLYLYMCFLKYRPLPEKAFLLTAIGIGFLVLVNLALGSGGELDLLLPFMDEHVICGVPTQPGHAPAILPGSANSLLGLLSYVLHHPAQSLRLAAQRTLAFFGLYRDYYGAGHNAYLIFFFSCIHLGALTSIGYWWKNNRPALCYLLSAIALVWLTVMMTCDDWHNRFYLGISPFLLMLGTPALAKILKRSLH